MKRTQILIVVALLALATACDGYGSSDRQQAAAAQQEANSTAREARQEAARETVEARTKANAETASAQAAANDTIRAANADKVKSQTAKPAKLDDFKVGLIEVEAKRNTLASDIGSVSASDATATAKVKDGIDERIDSLKARLDVLSKKL